MARQIIVSPAGSAEWAKVIEPGEPYEEGNPPEWTLDLVLDPGKLVAHYDFISQIEQWFQELHGSQAKPAEHGWPFKDHLDADKKPDGLTTVRFKRNTVSKKGNQVPGPVIVDAKKQPWDRELLIGNGSKVKVGFTYYGWERKGRFGISLDLAAVQVIDLVPYEAPDPTGAFGEEDGYVLPEPEETAGFKEETATAPIASRRGPRPSGDDEEIPF
ncbi:MAG: hypothetical protein VKI63_04380 [Cyanobium sp.]|nr:hypothetical protein [Cyanobium sp.]